MDEKDLVTAKIFTLYDPKGVWLGRIVITSDGFFGAVTDYGNACYAWRAFGDNFEDFILRLDKDYFAGKMSSGLAYIVTPTKRINAAYAMFAKKILPALHQAIKANRLSMEAINGRERP